MLIVVDPGTGVPVYRQVMDQVKRQVASGRLAPGDELPSTRVLSTELGVNPMTISKAYSFLEKDGIVERRPGRPVVVRGNGGGAAGKELLQAELAAIVTSVRQLGIPHEEAVALFRSMLAEQNDEEGAP